MESTPTGSTLKSTLGIYDALSTGCFGGMFGY